MALTCRCALPCVSNLAQGRFTRTYYYTYPECVRIRANSKRERKRKEVGRIVKARESRIPVHSVYFGA